MPYLRAREAACLKDWPRTMVQLLRRTYGLRSVRSSREGRASPAGALPYWTLLPRALAAKYGAEAGRSPRRHFVGDILWGQYCLFLFVRIQDDLFDGQQTPTSLAFVADQFVIEAERTFSRHFARTSRFWHIFRECLETTTRAILRVDGMQQRAALAPRKLLRGYAEVASIFKVGAAAVCIKFRRPQDLALLDVCSDELAMASQIVDDLEDVAEDLGRGRFNYVASSLLAGAPSTCRTNRELASARIARALALGNGTGRVLAAARRHLARAGNMLEELRCPRTRKYVIGWQAAMRDLEAAVHRARVELVLGRRLVVQRPAVRRSAFHSHATRARCPNARRTHSRPPLVAAAAPPPRTLP